MNTLRQYIDILSEADAPTSVPKATNPWTNDPVKAAAWDKLSPQVQQKLGGADPTDNIIISRMVKGGLFSGKPVTDANPDGTAKTPAAAPTPTPAPAPTATPVANAVAASGQPDDATGVDAAAAAQAGQPAQSAQPAAPTNRDSMTFGQAFKDARNKKEPKFTWKGKEYTTQLAPATPTATASVGALPSALPQATGQGKAGPTVAAAAGQDPKNPLNKPQTGQSGMPAPAAQEPANAAALRAQRDSFGQAYVAMKNNPNTPPAALAQMEKNLTDVGAKMKAAGISESETVGYAEDQNLVSIIHLAGLR
jgi:hypothetical protein